MLTARMNPADEPAVAELLRACGLAVDLPSEQSRPWARMWVTRASVRSPPVGFLLAWAVADELHIMQVATHPDARRRGAGGALLDAAIRLAVDTHARLIVLEVRRGNHAAIRLYRSRGFHVIGIRRGYYGDSGEDALEMMLNLDPVTGAIEYRPDELSIDS
jgi:[ribosomal protein S18]-alanine N-acetyltransferase